MQLRPRFSVEFLGLSFGVELPPADPLVLDGPPVSDRRFDRARLLADETIAALRANHLAGAVERLLALADEYPIDQRADAVKVSNRARSLVEGAELLSDERRAERSNELVEMILDAVAAYRAAADLAQHAAGGARARDRQPPLEPPEGGADAVQSDGDAASARVIATGPDDVVPAIRCSSLGWKAGQRWVLRDVDVELMSGSIVGVVGRNGAGKTTLLRLLAQDLRPSGGAVSYPSLRDRGYHSERLLDRIGYVPQIPTEYVGGLEAHLQRFAALRGLRGRALTDEVAYVIERFGLGGQRGAPWAALPGGFRTRVELARATLASPDILILDEPLGPLDSIAQREYLQYLRDLADSRRDICVIVTSQDLHAVAEIADYIIVVKDGDIPFAGPPALIEQTLSQRAYEFSGHLPMEELQTALAALPGSELRDGGMTRVLLTDETVNANTVLEALISGGEAVRYFRDLSRSPQQLLDDLGGAAADARD